MRCLTPPTSEGTSGGGGLVSDENKLPKLRSFVSASFTADTPCSILLSTVSAAPVMVSVALDKVDAGDNGASGKTSAVGAVDAGASAVAVGAGASAVAVGAATDVGASVCMAAS